MTTNNQNNTDRKGYRWVWFFSDSHQEGGFWKQVNSPESLSSDAAGVPHIESHELPHAETPEVPDEIEVAPGRWVVASTWPAFDASKQYKWRKARTLPDPLREAIRALLDRVALVNRGVAESVELIGLTQQVEIELVAVAREREQLFGGMPAANWVKGAREELADLRKERDESLRTARELAIALWTRHYKAESPQWEPLETTTGVILQISNMTAGMSEQIDQNNRVIEQLEQRIAHLETEAVNVDSVREDERIGLEGQLKESRQRIAELEKARPTPALDAIPR